MKKLIPLIVAVIAAFSIGAIHAAYNEISMPFSMSGPTAFIAEEGVTNVYTGNISGTGPAVIKGGGTVAFSNANNTYSGGTIVSNAVFRLDADGCAGVAAITGAVDAAHIFLNCANVPNDIRFLAGYSSTSLLEPGAYPAAGQYPLLLLRPEVTLFGDVVSVLNLFNADLALYAKDALPNTLRRNGV